MPRILIIDDPSLLLELERSFVRRHGFELRTAANGRMLLTMAAAQGADLIVAGTSMSDMSGFELCARLAETKGAGSIPILLFGAGDERERAEASGAGAFLAVPWTSADLLASLRRVLPLEARGAGRADVSLKVLCGEGAESYVAFTKDISATGLFLKGASLAAPGTLLRLRLRIPGDTSSEELHLSAEVVRCVARDPDASRLRGLGVRFLDFPLIRKVPITRFVRERSAE